MSLTVNKTVVNAGRVFAVSGRDGDIHEGTYEGLYAHDTRFLSRLRLSLQGREPVPLSVGQPDHTTATFYGSLRGTRGLPVGGVTVIRDRYVGVGLHEDVSLVNHSAKARKLRLAVGFDVDFADIFEVRRVQPRKARRVTLESRKGQHLCLVYRSDGLTRETWVSFSMEPKVKGRTAIFNVALPPKGVWKTCMTVRPVADSPPPTMKCPFKTVRPPYDTYRSKESSQTHSPRMTAGPHSQEADTPQLETNHLGLRLVYAQAVADLRSLRIEHLPGHPILGAGLPWYMTAFGRDSIVSSLQTKLLGPELMVGTLHTLAALQADKDDDFHEADPGKIPHEVRVGELSVLEEVPYSRYYGSVDATPLFLILLWEAYQWMGDENLLRRLLPAAEAALGWIDRYGDMDGDGFVEYKRRTRHGLRNQGWKDWDEAISFADGRLAQAPIALAEVQGYVYAAKRGMAKVHRLLGDARRAAQLERQAKKLKDRFNDAFWMSREGFFALALDGRKRQVDSIASNAGHCLWSGIVDEGKAPRIVERLMAPDMFSGWGIRTLSSEMGRYNPVSYHNGSVWPHDNSLAAKGMSRYGFASEAHAVALGMIEAAAAFPDHRLPELFAGHSRREHLFPVPYPEANAPQAWASGAVIYLLETLLGVMPAGDRLLRGASRGGLSIALQGVPYRGSRRLL